MVINVNDKSCLIKAFISEMIQCVVSSISLTMKNSHTNWQIQTSSTRAEFENWDLPEVMESVLNQNGDGDDDAPLATNEY